jgi:2-oxo-4-hydroxy-4-carboxy--5-ureidoimidazoline (OHCU) decarboxylase
MAAYPDLGGDLLEDGSVSDQECAGLTRPADHDRDEFAALASAYRERFGIPLIVCVRDHPERAAILAEGQRRLGNSPAQEHAAALIEIAKVANRRFEDLVAEANPIATARAGSFGSVAR